MTDYFALLDEPRRPWLDSGRLKEKFLALSARSHPDRLHQASAEDRQAAERQFTELNAAYNCLRETKNRIRHLLELERGEKPKDIESIPPDLIDYFTEVGGLCRQVDAFLAEQARVNSPILKVQLFERGQDWTVKINALQQRINVRNEELNAELQAMNPAWGSVPDRNQLPLERLETIYRLLGYFGRWTAQLQERNTQLAI